MDQLYVLSKALMRRIEPFFLLSIGLPRVDDRLILSAIIFDITNRLRYRDALQFYGHSETTYNRLSCHYVSFEGWQRMGSLSDGLGICKPIFGVCLTYRAMLTLSNLAVRFWLFFGNCFGSKISES
jgi:hypothetical protein